MTAANDRLYFSVGGQLFERTDGPEPSWKLAWQIPGAVNTEVGGIRGLTTVPSVAAAAPAAAALVEGGGLLTESPTYEKESLLFVWTPNGRSKGEIYRLDMALPRAAAASATLQVHNTTEASLEQLYNSHSAAAGPDAGLGSSRSSLGGYNKIFPFHAASSGELLHLIGFEQSLDNASAAVEFNGFYAGGCIAIRRCDSTLRSDPASSPCSYTTAEVNGLYAPGKPMLEAPRAFSLSPFAGEENVIYFGGFDANFHPSTNKAWIFKAGLNTVLAGTGGSSSAPAPTQTTTKPPPAPAPAAPAPLSPAAPAPQ